MALPDCNSTHPTCEREFSGCDQHALCRVIYPLRQDDPTKPGHCTCMVGYHGDGYWCRANVDPCQTERYGGCDRDRASCAYSPPGVTDLQDNEAVCRCLPGYEGNGTLCSQDMMDLVSRIPALTYFVSFLDQVTDINATELMRESTQNITLFAPLSENHADLKFSDLVVEGEMFRLPEKPMEEVKSSTQGMINQVTALGGQVINITVDSSGKLYANNVPIVEKNIATMNGLLHITETPISSHTSIHAPSSYSTEKSNSTIIAVCVVTIIVVAIIILVVAVLFIKSKKNGDLNIFNRRRYTKGSDTTVSFARLGAHEDDL
ncbi:hypothetical protein EGW08_015209 [Elysia chlorotica]|uniref:FAS1 domain-containing protein n=1 Tax=Elysia chlorotica TaxID=188477 RepID=A0A3S0ZGE2_ELYCH|nr:hypothetical protein EGW08_015209 [Elysia chlorotica]